jgi:hypothetical protein
VAAKLINAIDPDGVLPTDEAEHRLRRFFHLKHRTDGSWAGDFRLTPVVGQKLSALLGPLTKPQTPGSRPEPKRTRRPPSTSWRTKEPKANDSTTPSPPSSSPPSAPTTSPRPVDSHHVDHHDALE